LCCFGKINILKNGEAEKKMDEWWGKEGLF
jgi:hypothetical protein